MPYKYKISSTEVKPFTYKIPLVSIDENGEAQVSFAKNNKNHIKKITFLNLIGRNEQGDIVSFEPMDQVNTFLMAHHIDEEREESCQRSKACKVMGVSRDTFYRYQELVETGGLDALIDKSRRAPNIKNRVDDVTENAVVQYAIDYPAHGQHRTSNELRKQGIFVSGSGVRSIWLRHDLENFKKRLKALEGKVANEGIILTDSQIAALEKKKQDDEACGEIDTAHPGYLGSQDTFYVGNLKGVGRIYQQIFVDTYSKVAANERYLRTFPQNNTK